MHGSIPQKLPEAIRLAPRKCPEPFKAARDLRSTIEAGAAKGEQQGFVPDEVIAAIADAGLWGLRVPREFGGEEADGRTYIDVIEEISYADGSTGWVFMAIGYMGGGVGLGPSAVERIYGGDEGLLSASQISSLGKAERIDGGYRIWDGHFHFGSGSRYASWFGGAFALQENGKPLLRPDGKPQTVMCFVPRDKARILGNWDVMGLVATGSYDFDIVDQEVTDDWVMGVPGRKPIGGPIHALGISLGHVAWALGVGQRALDEIEALAMRKRRFQRDTLVDQTRFQLEYGRHLAAMQAARTQVHKVFFEWEEAAKAGQAGIKHTAQARLTACWATEVALAAAQFAMFAAGSSGLRNDETNRIQRAFRDLQTGSTHRHIDQEVLIECTQVALGIADPDLTL